jgi:hypothetical protein
MIRLACIMAQTSDNHARYAAISDTSLSRRDPGQRQRATTTKTTRSSDR